MQDEWDQEKTEKENKGKNYHIIQDRHQSPDSSDCWEGYPDSTTMIL